MAAILHETTQLCLKALEETVRGGEAVLDMGCGSGILSVVAALLGASHVIGADIDDKAAEVSRKNARLNGVEGKTEFFACDLCEDDSCVRRSGGFDVVVVNIVADVIIALLPKAREAFKPADGTLILSGIIDSRLEDVLAALKAADFELAASRSIPTGAPFARESLRTKEGKVFPVQREAREREARVAALPKSHIKKLATGLPFPGKHRITQAELLCLRTAGWTAAAQRLFRTTGAGYRPV